MGLLQLLIQDPLTFFLLAIPLLYSIIIHELAHGWVASLMGDPTAKYMGRLTLNPLKHLDPIGTAMLFIFGFGWAKPVPVNLSLVRNTRLGLIWVSAAGIIANLLFAFLAILLLPSALSAAFRIDRAAALLSGADQHHARLVQPDPHPAPGRIEDRHGFPAGTRRDTPWPAWNLTDSSSSSDYCTWGLWTRSSISSAGSS